MFPDEVSVIHYTGKKNEGKKSDGTEQFNKSYKIL